MSRKLTAIKKINKKACGKFRHQKSKKIYLLIKYVINTQIENDKNISFKNQKGR